MCYNIIKNYIGYVSIDLATSPKNVVEATKKVAEGIKELLNRGITEEEIKRAKRKFLNANKFSLENTSDVALDNSYGIIYYNTIRTLKEYEESIESITVEEVNRVLKKVFEETPVNINLVGNEEKEDLLKIYRDARAQNE
ncbi:MAG: insulinase family protein [Spirochaetales bacterium]